MPGINLIYYRTLKTLPTQIKAGAPREYVDQLPPERKEAINKLRKEILKNLPRGFSETINYGMIGYVVPHSVYPPGYHCDPKSPLPFINIASQKTFVAEAGYGQELHKI